MTYPKFAVGEDVLICSEHYPRLNGCECLVTDSEWHDGQNRYGEPYAGWKYLVSPQPHESDYPYWQETALRKRPADLSFNELITSLKIKEPV